MTPPPTKSPVKKRVITPVETSIQNALASYNTSLVKQRLDYQLSVEVERRNKKFMLNDTDFFEMEIGELLVIKTTLIDITGTRKTDEPVYQTTKSIIYRIEHTIPNQTLEERANKFLWVNRLFEAFIYECLGNFFNVLETLFMDKQMTEYDLKFDHFLGDKAWKDRKIEIKKDNLTTWYKEKEKYFVFSFDGAEYIVYTWNEEGKKHRGFASVPATDAVQVVPILLADV